MKNWPKIKILTISFILLMSYATFADWLTEGSAFDKYYNGGEPDYADGDLEDKLGDSGYYYDLFPEERDEEDDLHDAPKKAGNITELDQNLINNAKNMDTRIFRFEFPDGTTGYGTRSDYEKIIKEKYSYGATKIGDNIYYKNFDGTYKTGWHLENNKWYYFDKETFALVKNKFVEDNGKFYYIGDDYTMLTNQYFTLPDFNIYIDKNGECTIIK